jgi:uncharacterized membrane protein YjgN (DUF898 family)
VTSAARALRPRFHGDGGSLFFLHLKNILLTIITFGIYTFWAKTEVRKYLYGQLSLGGDRFQYHGTGGELFKGWLKAAGIYIVLSFGAQFIAAAIGVGMDDMYVPLVAAAVLALSVLFFLIPLALLGTRRYRLSRSSWRGIRFSFRGKLGEIVKLYGPGSLLTLFTLGLYFPVFEMRMRTYLVNESRFGSAPFRFDGKASEVYGRMLLGLFLSLLTLGIYYPWYVAFKHRYYWSKTSIAGAHFESTVRGGDLFVFSLVNFFLLVITLGIAYPWVQAREMVFHTDRLVLHGTAEFNDVVQEMSTATATGAELAEMFDVEIVGADLFGL